MELSSVGKVILGVLRDAPHSGYEIKRIVDRSTRFFWAASYGQIYPELRRLEETGLIVGASDPRGGRPRRVFHLTPAGRDALRDWLTGPESAYELRDEGLLKLFFADALSHGDALALLRAFRGDRQRVVERLREIEETIPKHVEGFPLLVLEYGIELHEWMVEWCERTEERLAAQEGARVEEART